MNCKEAEKKIPLYIERKLTGAELEDFLEHVEHCPDCSEELEVNFSIYYALKQLTAEKDESFDMKKLLRRDMNAAKEYLREEDNRQFLERFTKITILLLSALIIGVCIEGKIAGDFKRTRWYKMFQPDPVVLEVAYESEKAAEAETELQTNHKNQIIIRIPETEEAVVPEMIPDEF